MCAVDAETEWCDESPNSGQHCGIIREHGIGRNQPTAALDPDIIECIHEDVAHSRIVHQRLERSEADDSVDRSMDDGWIGKWRQRRCKPVCLSVEFLLLQWSI